MDKERKKFKQFYIYSTLVWLIFLMAYILVRFYAARLDIYSELLDGVLQIVLEFAVFGIPIILFFSIFIRSAEKIMNKIADVQAKKGN